MDGLNEPMQKRSTDFSSPNDSILQDESTSILKESHYTPDFFTSLWTGTIGIVAFELRRTFTPTRLLIWVALALFPVFIIGAVTHLISEANSTHNFSMDVAEQKANAVVLLTYVLPIEVVTILSMLLWATPIVHAELEGETWVYYVVRFNARWMLLWGKFIAAVLWTAACTIFSVTLISILFVYWDGKLSVAHFWIVGSMLCLLSSLAHGVLFLTIGTFFQRRAMVVAFAYCVTVEGILAWLPAVINRFTVSYRLRSIMAHQFASDLSLSKELDKILITQDSSVIHAIWLLTFTLALLFLASLRVKFAQYRMLTET